MVLQVKLLIAAEMAEPSLTNQAGSVRRWHCFCRRLLMKHTIFLLQEPKQPDCSQNQHDFDDGEWQKDISALKEVCAEFAITVAVERSRSGNGGHAWFFFEKPVAASLARNFGTSLLTYTMGKRHEITFKSYDRFFPNQDTMPKGGLGNLIALPLQKQARMNKNSEFLDGDMEPYADQWAFLDAIRRLSQIESEDKTARGSFLLLDAEGRHLLTGAAPSLPPFYNQAIHGIEIGMGVGSCGTAAYLGQRVIVKDIHTHNYLSAGCLFISLPLLE